MPYYEVTYETGRCSVAFYSNDDEAQAALGEHHRRAIEGELGGPIGGHDPRAPGAPTWPAERVVLIRMYDKHPNEHNPEQTMSAEVLDKEVAALVKALADDNGVVNVDRLSAEVRGLTHPMYVDKEHPFDSNFKMKEKRVLTLKGSE